MSAAPENSATLFVYASQSQATGEVTAHQAEGGFTAREHAAIALRVPDSGNDWLDAMIRTAQRNDLAKAAMQGWLASYGPDEKHPVAMDCEKAFARLTHALADAMLSGAQIAEGE